MENIAQSTNIYQVKNERMGGFVPSWDAPKNAPEPKTFDNILSSYNAMPEAVEIIPARQDKEFGFFDIIDMVNPLQHIPLVNMAYRSLTGDEIKPVSKIIGGGVFGGVAGLAGGIVNAIIEKETGKDVIGNIMSFAGINNEKQNDFNKEFAAYEDLPASLLSFAQTPIIPVSEENKDKHEYQRIEIAQGRTAGDIAVYS